MAFQVHIPSGFSNRDLRNLSETEKAFAGAQGWTESEFIQRKLEWFEKEQRAHERGRQLGELVAPILNELGENYELNSVTRNNDTMTWRLEVNFQGANANVVLPWDLVDRVLDFRTKDEFSRLRNLMLVGLGRADIVFEGRRR